MSYQKLNLNDGDILTGDNMDHIEDGIAACVSIEENQNLTDTQKENARENIGAVSATVSGTTLVIG